jgi:hypothetical protein
MTDAEPKPSLEKPSGFSLALNFLPFLHLALGLAVAFAACGTAWGRFGIFSAWIYLTPPLAAQLVQAVFGRPSGRLTQDMPAYRVWWALTQLQVVFNRLPWIEEILRLVPGLYALWIRLWGGELSPFAYVGPGVTITDRHMVRVERGAVLGIRGALAGHMATRDADGRWLVIIGLPQVEAEAVLGGEAGLGPGAILRRGAVLPPRRHIPAFGEWPKRAGGGEEGS